MTALLPNKWWGRMELWNIVEVAKFNHRLQRRHLLLKMLCKMSTILFQIREFLLILQTIKTFNCELLLRIWEILKSYLLQIFRRVFVSCIFIWKILLRNAYDPICHGSNDINNIQVFLTRIILTQSCHHSSFFFMKLAHLVHLSELWQQHLTMKYKKCKTWSPTTMIILCTNYFVSSYSHFLHSGLYVGDT